MIPEFEEYTKDVSDEDIGTINIISSALKLRVGKSKAITNNDMREGLSTKMGINITSAKMRRYIQYIRAYRLVSMLCASKKGYYVAENKETWFVYRDNYKSRMTSMNFTLTCMYLDNPIQ